MFAPVALHWKTWSTGSLCLMNASNQSMKPTAPFRYKSSVFATTPCRGLNVDGLHNGWHQMIKDQKTLDARSRFSLRIAYEETIDPYLSGVDRGCSGLLCSG
jgi:hypothetical protein